LFYAIDEPNGTSAGCALMKKIFIKLNRHRLTLSVAFLAIGWVFSGPEVMSAAEQRSPTPVRVSEPAGRLVIVRSATLGPTVIGLRIDGVEMAKISYNRRYDAPLAAGQHTLTVYPVTSLEGAKPTETRVNVRPGKDLYVHGRAPGYTDRPQVRAGSCDWLA
jgi:hypothetical protein